MLDYNGTESLVGYKDVVVAVVVVVVEPCVGLIQP